MKRGLVLSLCAAAVVAMTSPALAVVDAQLNLRYTDPNSPGLGGTWDLLVQSDGVNGLAGIDFQINGGSAADLGVTGIDTGSVTANAAVFDNTNSVFRFRPEGSGIEIVAGDDLVAANLVLNVGKGAGTPGNVADDDLFLNTASAGWNNSALIASGVFGGTRPVLVVEGANEFDAGNAAVAATNGVISVRGDNAISGEILPGDADRNGTVNLDDLTILGTFFNQAATWDQGDFNSSPNADLDDLTILGTFFNQSVAPPAAGASIGAVPEPSSLALLALGVCSLAIRKRS